MMIEFWGEILITEDLEMHYLRNLNERKLWDCSERQTERETVAGGKMNRYSG